jgi:hypothetical protein
MKKIDKSHEDRFEVHKKGAPLEKKLVDPNQAFSQQPSLVEEDVAILKLCQTTSE